MELRPVRFEEVPEVLRLVERSIAFGCRSAYTAEQRGAVFATYAHALFVEALGPFEGIVAAVGGHLVGFAQLDPRRAHLRALFVDGSSQGQGVGRALLAEVESRAVRHGCSRLHGAMSLNAAPFYAAAGFRAGNTEALIATSLDGSATVSVPIVRMEKRLEKDLPDKDLLKKDLDERSPQALRAASGFWSARKSL